MQSIKAFCLEYKIYIAKLLSQLLKPSTQILLVKNCNDEINNPYVIDADTMPYNKFINALTVIKQFKTKLLGLGHKL